MRKSLDPRICNIALDANALDRDGSARDQLVDRFEELAADGTLNVVLPGGVRDEINNPGTPTAVKDALLPRIFNLRPGLIAEQKAGRRRVLAIIQGNAKAGKHAADASHLSEAAETGCGYFVTHDARILRKRRDLRSALPPHLTIVTLEDLLMLFDNYACEDANKNDANMNTGWRQYCLTMAADYHDHGFHRAGEHAAELAMIPPHEREWPPASSRNNNRSLERKSALWPYRADVAVSPLGRAAAHRQQQENSY